MMSLHAIRNSAYFAMILAVVAGVLLVGNVAQAALIHHYEAEGNANDSVAGGHNGVWGGGSSYAASVPGMGLGQAFNFDKSNQVNTNLPSIPVTSDRTIAFWMKAGVQSGSSVVISQGVGVGANASKGINFNFGSFGATNLKYCCDGVDGLTEGVQEFKDYPQDTDNDWHHVAVTYNGTSFEHIAYLDGVVATTFRSGLNGLPPGGGQALESGPDVLSWIHEDLPSPNNFRMGTSHQNAPRSYNGLLDDVRIYDNILTGAEVAALVPEPTAYLLLVAGLGIILAARRRKRS